MNLRGQWTGLGSLTLIIAFLAAASPSLGSALASTGSLDILPGKTRGSELAGNIKPSFEANVRAGRSAGAVSVARPRGTAISDSQ